MQDVFQTKNEVLILPGGEAGAFRGSRRIFSPQDKVLFGIEWERAEIDGLRLQNGSAFRCFAWEGTG